MQPTKDDAIAMAGAAETPEEIERAMRALATLPSDAEVDAARAELSLVLDQRTRGLGSQTRAGSRVGDMAVNPGFDNN
jgi:hypothetical protein